MGVNPFLVYCRELAPGTVSLTGDRAQGDDSNMIRTIVLSPCFVICVLSSFAIISLVKRELVCCVAVIPRDAFGWSVECDYGISWSYSLFCFVHVEKFLRGVFSTL